MRKKKILLLLSISVTAATICAVVPMMGNTGSILGATNECSHHHGNHYLANDPTCSESGNLEFWACCDCLTQYTVKPDGDWVDCGVYSGNPLSPEHVAYVAPTGEHHYGLHAVDSTTNPGYVDIVKSCDECGTVEGGVIKSMLKKTNATFEADFELSHPWSYDPDTNKYTSNGVDGNSSFLRFYIKSNGILSFDYDVSTESGWDKFYCGVNGPLSGDWLSAISGTKKGSTSKEVTAGQTVYFTYNKDGSGKSGRDNVIITVTSASFVYNALEFVSNGGSACEPSFIENGVVVGDIPETTREGMYFEGWYMDEEFTTPYVDQKFSGDAKLYAKWSEPLVVTLNANGGQCVPSVSFRSGTTPVIPDPTKDDYHFVGWYLDSYLTDPYVPEEKNESFSLWAKWISVADTHELYGTYGGFKFKPNSTSAPSDAYATLTVDFVGNYALRTAYSSDYDETGSLGSVVNGVCESTNNGIVQTFDDNNIVVIHEKSTYSTSSYYYVLFKGSEPTKSGTTSSSVRSLNKASFVRFTYQSNTVILMVDNSTGLATFDVSVCDSNGDSIDYTKIGTNSFEGMFFVVKNSASEIIKQYGYDTSATVVTETFTGIKGTYTSLDSKKIVFSGNGKAITSFNGSNVCDVTVKSDNVYVVGNGTTYKTITVNEIDHSFTYTDTLATLTYNACGGEFSGGVTVKDATVGYGTWFDETKKVENPTRDGYSFEGWYVDSEYKTKASTWTRVYGDKTYYAKWAAAITVTFNLNNGSDPVIKIVGEGNKVTIDNPTAPEGKYFVGWFIEDVKVDLSTYTVTEDVTFDAHYDVIPSFINDYKRFNIYGSSTTTRTGYGNYYIRINGSYYMETSTTVDISTVYDPINNKLHGQTFYIRDGHGFMFHEVPDSDWYFFASNTATVKQYCLSSIDYTWLFNVSYAGGDNYSFLANKAGLFVPFVTIKSGGEEVSFDTFYSAPRGTYSSISLSDGSTTYTYGYNGSDYVLDDGYSGTYTGTFCGVADSEIVFDGFGNAVVNDTVNGSYVVNGAMFDIVLPTGTYQITISGSTFTQILDGFEGSYTGERGTLIISGYGTLSLVGDEGTYEIVSSNMIKAHVNDEYIFFTLEDDTYVVSSASPFAGSTYSGTHQDWSGDQETITVTFDDSPLTQGSVQFGGPLFKASFTGEIEGTSLTITFTSDIYASGLIGKTVTFEIGVDTLTVTASQLTSGTYRFQVGVVVTKK